MDKKTIGDWIMYHEVKRLIREGLSLTAIGKALVIDDTITFKANKPLYRLDTLERL